MATKIGVVQAVRKDLLLSFVPNKHFGLTKRIVMMKVAILWVRGKNVQPHHHYRLLQDPGLLELAAAADALIRPPVKPATEARWKATTRGGRCTLRAVPPAFM